MRNALSADDDGDDIPPYIPAALAPEYLDHDVASFASSDEDEDDEGASPEGKDAAGDAEALESGSYLALLVAPDGSWRRGAGGVSQRGASVGQSLLRFLSKRERFRGRVRAEMIAEESERVNAAAEELLAALEDALACVSDALDTVEGTSSIPAPPGAELAQPAVSIPFYSDKIFVRAVQRKGFRQVSVALPQKVTDSHGLQKARMKGKARSGLMTTARLDAAQEEYAAACEEASMAAEKALRALVSG